MGAKQYRVTAPYVLMKLLDPASGKLMVRDFHQGAPVPEMVDPVSLKSLLDQGMVEEIEETEAPVEPEGEPEGEPEKEPTTAVSTKKLGDKG